MTGYLDHELKNGYCSMGPINRRNIADSLRHLDLSQEPPTIETLNDFDDFMSGKGFRNYP